VLKEGRKKGTNAYKGRREGRRRVGGRKEVCACACACSYVYVYTYVFIIRVCGDRAIQSNTFSTPPIGFDGRRQPFFL
jgi:hypothetical protein